MSLCTYKDSKKRLPDSSGGKDGWKFYIQPKNLCNKFKVHAWKSRAQRDQKFEVILCYTVSSMLPYVTCDQDCPHVTRDPFFKKKKLNTGNNPNFNQ